MKKRLLLILLVGIIFYGFMVVKDRSKEKRIDKGKESLTINVQVEKEKIDISSYYVYGTHLNIIGSFNNISYDGISLVLVSSKEEEIKLVSEKKDEVTGFKISDKINDGYNLENVALGNYYLFLKVEKDKKNYYYALTNKTEYKEVVYYTLSNKNYKVLINSQNDYGTLGFGVTKNLDEGIYDITIDAGHGGNDAGAVGNGYYEKNIALSMALKLKDDLIKKGLKVNITRDSDVALSSYNKGGRAVIPNESNAKYAFSIHLNSHVLKNISGVEILTPSKIDYTLAKNLANNIVDKTGTGYSTNKGFKMYKGVYTRTFDQDDVNLHYKDATKEGTKAYDVKVGNCYYYMIRETGGIVTGAYVDGRNEDKGLNPYYHANKGVETYIIELGYIISKTDVNNILNKKDLYIEAISSTIGDYLGIS